MNILQIVPELKVGGVETGTVDLSRELVKKGHKTLVVSHGGGLVEKLIQAGAEHITLPVHKKNPFSIFQLSFRLRKIIHEHKIDIVHARSRVPAWIAFFAVRGTSAHFITSCHGYYSRHFGSRVMGWGERVIAVSRIIEEHMSHAFHVPFARMRVIPRGIDVRKFSTPQKEPRHEKDKWHIGLIGRLTPIKGHIYFLKAIKEIVAQVPNVRAFIIGDASEKKLHYKDELLELTEKLGIKENVVFTGSCSNISQVLHTLDCLCMSSIVPEAFGRVIIEAQAAKVPVVATRIGGAIDIIDDTKTGILVEPRNAHQLAEGILTILTDHAGTKRMVEAAFSRVSKRYTLKRMVAKTISVYEEVLKSPRILIVKYSSFGDIVLVSPSLRSIREKYPQAFISVITYPQYHEVLRNCPYIDDIIEYDRNGRHHRLRGFLRLVWEVRRRRYSYVIDLQNNARSHTMTFLSKSRVRLGYERARRGFMLTHKVPYKKKNINPIESQRRLLKGLDIAMPDNHLEFWFSKDDSDYINDFLVSEKITKKDPFICLFPGSNPRWASKRWPLEKFASISDELYKVCGTRSIFIGGKDNAFFSPELVHLVKHPYIDAIGKTTIAQLGALISRCTVLVTSDSAPLHIGVALGVPVLALFGPTNPKRHIPPGDVTVFYNNISCSPCYSPECKKNEHECMNGIKEQEVMARIKEILDKK